MVTEAQEEDEIIQRERERAGLKVKAEESARCEAGNTFERQEESWPTPSSTPSHSTCPQGPTQSRSVASGWERRCATCCASRMEPRDQGSSALTCRVEGRGLRCPVVGSAWLCCGGRTCPLFLLISRALKSLYVLEPS